MNITEKNIRDLKPYKNNAKKHPKEQVERIAQSIKEFGFTQPVLIDKENNVVAGHGRVLGAKKAGLKKVPTITLDQLTEEQIKAYRLVDNKLNESPWDSDLLEQSLSEILFIDMDVFGFNMFGEQGNEDSNKYTMKTGVPQYDVKGECPDIKELINIEQTKNLIKHIEESNVTQKQKQFLKFAAYRHVVFRYDKIAEYYAQQNKEMQQLMEESALVIIDYNDAIRYGYVDLMQGILDMESEDEA